MKKKITATATITALALSDEAAGFTGAALFTPEKLS